MEWGYRRVRQLLRKLRTPGAIQDDDLARTLCRMTGARSVRDAVPDALLIFLLPPSWEELVRRLTGRGTEDTADQSRRLETARTELSAQDEFDFRVVNADVGTAAQEVVTLMDVPSRR